MVGKYKHLDEDTLQKIKERYEEGKSIGTIARVLKIDRSTVYRKVKLLEKKSLASIVKNLNEKRRSRKMLKRKLNKIPEAEDFIISLVQKDVPTDEIQKQLLDKFKIEVLEQTIDDYTEYAIHNKYGFLIFSSYIAILLLFLSIYFFYTDDNNWYIVFFSAFLLFIIRPIEALITIKSVRLKNKKSIFERLHLGWKHIFILREKLDGEDDRKYYDIESPVKRLIILSMFKDWTIQNTKKVLEKEFNIRLSNQRIQDIQQSFNDFFSLNPFKFFGFICFWLLQSWLIQYFFSEWLNIPINRILILISSFVFGYITLNFNTSKNIKQLLSKPFKVIFNIQFITLHLVNSLSQYLGMQYQLNFEIAISLLAFGIVQYLTVIFWGRRSLESFNIEEFIRSHKASKTTLR